MNSIKLLNTALFIRAMILLSPVMLLFYQENGLTVKELFFFQGFFYLISILIELPVGYIADIFSKKKVLIFSFISFLAGIILWFNFSGYGVILTGEILFAISKVTMDTASSGYLYDCLQINNKQQKMPKYWGYTNFYLAAGTAVAAFVGTYLYSKFGSHNVLLIEIALIILGIFLLASMSIAPPPKREKKPLLIEKYKSIIDGIKCITHNEKIKYYILYSGLLTSMSVLFSLSFQQLMLKSLFPIALFGVIAFANHGIRAFSSLLAGKFFNNYNIYNLRVPLYFLYILAFLIIFFIIKFQNIYVNLFLLITICMIIGIQLLFTILHVSRMHKYVDTAYRGAAASVNNIVPKIISVCIFLSSKIFISHSMLFKFFLIYFIFFLVAGIFLLIKTNDIKD